MAMDAVRVAQMEADERFDRAVRAVLWHEGGLVDDPRDPGGITNYGVSLRYLARLGRLDPANGYLLGDLDGDGDIDADDIRAMTPEAARRIYWSQWWDRYGYARIGYEPLAAKLLDLAINLGPGRAHELLQEAVASILGCRIKVDGILGPQSIGYINAVADQAALLEAFRGRARRYYISLHRPEYLKGWLLRLND